MLTVTLAPTVVQASEKINVIPARAWLKVDCRVPPGMGGELALRRLHEVLGDAADDLEIEFTEQVYGYMSSPRTEVMSAIDEWIGSAEPGARTVPVLLPIAVDLGIDPVYFGVVMIMNLMLGLLTPPVGSVLYITSSVTGQPVDVVFRGVAPFLIPLGAVLVLVTAFPAVVLWLPRVLGF